MDISTEEGEKLEPIVTLSSYHDMVAKMPHRGDWNKIRILHLLNHIRHPLPYPSQVKHDLLEQERKRFREQAKGLSVNTSFIESIVKMPTYMKFFKGIISNKTKKEKLSKVVLNDKC